MKIYDIVIEPETKMSDTHLEILAKEIKDNFFVLTSVYATIPSFDKKITTRICIENIKEDTIPDLLMFLDNIAWGGYKIIYTVETEKALP